MAGNGKDDLVINIRVDANKVDTEAFRSKIEKALNKIAGATKIINIDANTEKAGEKIYRLDKQIRNIINNNSVIELSVTTRNAENKLDELKKKLNDFKISLDTSKFSNQINNALKEVSSSDAIKKLKIGINSDGLLKEINRAITTINSSDSLKKLKLGVDANYLQQQLNKVVKGLDTTVKLKTKLETTSRTTDTKGTVTTNKTSKEDSNEYKSLFSKRAASIQNLDRAYQEFGRNSKEVSAAIREFAAASKDVRKFGRDTGVLSLNKIKSDIERQLGAGLTTDFTKNWLRMEYDKVLKDIDNLDRQLKPEKYEKIRAKAEYKRLEAEHKDLADQLKAVANAYKEEAAEVRRRTSELKFRYDVAKGVSKGTLQQLADSAKNDKVLDSNKMQKFFDELEVYRNLINNRRSSFYKTMGENLGIGENHPYFNRMREKYQEDLNSSALWRYKATKDTTIPIKVDNKASFELQKVGNEINQLRSQAINAGKALNQAMTPKDIENTKRQLDDILNRLINIKKNSNSGLTLGGESRIYETLLNAIGASKGSRTYDYFMERMRKASRGQRDINDEIGDNPWRNRLDYGRVISSFGYAARGPLNAIQEMGSLLSTLSRQEGTIGAIIRGFTAFTAALVGIGVAVNAAISAFNFLSSTIMSIGNTIYNALKPGIELYKSRETAELSIAAAISARATENGKDISFERATEYAQTLMERVIKDAAVSAFNPQDLIDALRGTLPLALGKGLNVEQSYELTKGVASVAKVTRLASNQVLQELRDILQGTISARSSQVAGATGITGEGLRQADEQGKLYEYIIDHLKTFTFALNRYSSTLSGTLDRLSESWAMGMEQVFQAIAPQTNALVNYFIDNFVGGIYENIGTKENPMRGKKLTTPEEIKEAQNAEFFRADWLKDFEVALKDFLDFIGPVIDDVISFIKELTGTPDTIKAVSEAIKYAIRVTVALGKIILTVFKGIIDLLIELEAPISVTMNVLLQLSKSLYYFGASVMDVVNIVVDCASMLWKALNFDWEGVKELGDKAFSDFKKNIEKDLSGLKSAVFADRVTSYNELFGTDVTSLKKESGEITKALEEVKNAEQPKKSTNMDLSQAEGKRVDDALKQNLADARKMLQAFLEGLKQQLKQALAELKDRAEQNDLAYRQGYKSIEDYFTEKAQIEYEESQFKLQALLQERNAIADLDTGGDASAQYQKERDLVRIDGEILLQQRESDKKQAQLVEIAGAIEHQLQNTLMQQGIRQTTHSMYRNAMNGGDMSGGLNSGIQGVLNSWQFPLDVAEKIVAAAKKYNINPLLLLALAQQESGGDQSVVSSAGAVGVMQLMPDTAESLKVDANDINQNIEGGAKYLADMLKEFNNNIELALAAYNAGPGAIEEAGYNIPNYGETQQYVPNVISLMNELQEKLGSADITQGIVENSSDLSEAMYNAYKSSEWFYTAMEHAGEGCVEFVTKFGSLFSDFYKQAVEDGILGMTVENGMNLTPYAESKGITVDYNVPIETARELARVGDTIAVNAGLHAALYLGGGKVLHNASSTYKETTWDDNHIKESDIGDWDDDYVNIIRTSETMHENFVNLGNSMEQVSTTAQNTSNEVQQRIRNNLQQLPSHLEEFKEFITGRFPQAFSPVVEAYYKATEEGLTTYLESVKNYESYMNDNPFGAVAATVASVYAKLKRDADKLGTKFANQYPQLKDMLDRMIPIETLKAEANVLQSYADNRLKMIEDDSTRINKKLREKTMLYPEAIEKYFSYFTDTINDYTITEMITRLERIASELASQGAISLARDIMSKVTSLQSKFADMINSWISEMGNYFNYERELIDVDTGLPSFVKEERKRQLDLGQARVNAVAYGESAKHWESIESNYHDKILKNREKLLEIEEKIEEAKAKQNDKDVQAHEKEKSILLNQEKILEMGEGQAEQQKVIAERQAEINKLKGEEKTLWQETMDVANQALQDGLYNFMTNYVNTAESIGDAFRQMAVDILSDLQKFFAKKAITDLMHMITGTPNEEYFAPERESNTWIANNTAKTNLLLENTNLILSRIAEQQSFNNNMSNGYGGFSSYGMDGTSSSSPFISTSSITPVNSGLGMFGYKDYATYKAMTVSAPGVEESVANSTAQTVATTMGFQTQMTTMLPTLFGTLGGTLVGIINALGSVAASLGLLYLTYEAIKYILDAVVNVSYAILDAVVNIGHAILDAIVDIGKEFVKLFAYVAGLILDWNTSAVGLARSIFGNSDDDAIEQTDAITLLSSILSTLSAIYGVNSAIASKLGVDTGGKPEAGSEEGSEGNSTVTTTTDTDISDSDTLSEENKMLVDSIYQRRVLEKLELIVSALDTILKLNIVGLIMQLISIITMANVGKAFGSFKSTFKNNFGFATGGYISGKGTSISDSIPAMLSNGEYVIKADAVRRYGTNFLDAVNDGKFARVRTSIPHFAEGGYVNDTIQDTARGITDFAKHIGSNVSMNNDISIALVRDESEAIRTWAKSPNGGQKFLVDFMKGNGRVFSRFVG